MRGQGKTVDLLLSRAEDQKAALLIPNKDGLGTFHLTLMAGNSELAQQAALQMMGVLGDELVLASNIMLSKEKIKETPLLLAIGSHQVCAIGCMCVRTGRAVSGSLIGCMCVRTVRAVSGSLIGFSPVHRLIMEPSNRPGSDRS